MKNKLTHLVFIVDRSGCINVIVEDMIGGFNRFIEDQKKIDEDCFVSFYQFDDVYEISFERKSIKEVQPLNRDTYMPRGMTRLHDAMGKTINNYGSYLNSVAESERPERILVVTITDGHENDSKEYTLNQVSEMVKHQTEKYGWDFVFLGANIDAWGTGSHLNINQNSMLQFAQTKAGTDKMFDSLSNNIISYRSAINKQTYNFNKSDYLAQDEELPEDLKNSKKVFK